MNFKQLAAMGMSVRQLALVDILNSMKLFGSGTQATALIDMFLTNVSQKVKAKGYISEELLPMIQVAQFSGKIAKYGNDHLRILNTLTGGKNGYMMVESDVRSSDQYNIETHSLKHIITEEDFRNVIRPFDARRDAMSKLISHLWLGKEKSLADAMGDTSVLTNNTTLSGTDQYNDYVNSDPIGDSIVAHESIADATGMQADTISLSRKVFKTLRYHPKILDALGFKDNRPGGLTVEEIGKALDVERVLVGATIYNAAKEGQADDLQPVWAKNLIYSLTPRTASLEQKTLGYRLQLAGTSPRQVFRFSNNEPVNSETVIVQDKYELLFTDVAAAYLYKNAIL